MDGRREEDRQYATDMYPAGQPLLIVDDCLLSLPLHVSDDLVEDSFGSLGRIDEVEHIS